MALCSSLPFAPVLDTVQMVGGSARGMSVYGAQSTFELNSTADVKVLGNFSDGGESARLFPTRCNRAPDSCRTDRAATRAIVQGSESQIGGYARWTGRTLHKHAFANERNWHSPSTRSDSGGI